MTKLVQLARLELLIQEMELVIKVSYPSCSVELSDTEVPRELISIEYTQIEMLNKQVWEKIRTRASIPVRDRTAPSALGKSGFGDELAYVLPNFFTRELTLGTIGNKLK